MKRILKPFFLIFMFCCFTNVIFAKTVKDTECYYTIKNPIGDVMTEAKIQIIGYNDGAGGSVVVYFKNADDKYIEYDGPNYDWKNYGGDIAYPTAMLRFFTTDKKGTTYISNYKKNGRCPVIYSNVVSDGMSIDVENYVLNTEFIDSTSESLQSTKENLRGSDGDWVSREDFYKDDSTGQTTVKEDLVCSYDMEFDRYNIKSPVEFRTMYNASNGAKTYRISVNNNGSDYTTLTEDVLLILGQGGSDLVYISSEQLPKIFLDGKCLDRTKIYHYYDMSTSRYVITTDEQEASENGTAGRYDNGDGSNDGQAGSSNPDVNANIEQPDLDIYGGSMTCVELLGSGLTKILNFAIDAIRIIGVIASIIMAMIKLIPAVNKGDQGELNNAIKKCIWIAVVLCIIVLFPLIVRVIGNLFGFDISCIF